MLIAPSPLRLQEPTRRAATVQTLLQREAEPAASRQLMWGISDSLVVPSGRELMSESAAILLGCRIPLGGGHRISPRWPVASAGNSAATITSKHGLSGAEKD